MLNEEAERGLRKGVARWTVLLKNLDGKDGDVCFGAGSKCEQAIKDADMSW